MANSVLQQLKSIVNQIDNCSPCCPPPCCPQPAASQGPSGCPPCPYPYPQVCMMSPPPCPAPTEPKYVKPLALPTPPCPPSNEHTQDPERDYKTRFANFYNNYNVDYHNQGPKCKSKHQKSSPWPCDGVAVDGKSTRCEDYMKMRDDDDECEEQGCPTGFKPCKMQLCGPPGCDPLGIWKATIQPCPPKPKKRVSNKYVPGECKRPCCKHWKLKDGPCLYDKPCKAHCYDHPPGIKPSHEY